MKNRHIITEMNLETCIWKKKTEVCVRKHRMGNEDVEKVFIPPFILRFRLRGCRILTKGSRLPHDSEASWKGWVWHTVSVYQGPMAVLLPVDMDHRVTCCLNDLIYRLSFWCTQSSNKSLSQKQNGIPDKLWCLLTRSAKSAFEDVCFPKLNFIRK